MCEENRHKKILEVSSASCPVWIVIKLAVDILDKCLT